ncbi:MAG: TVP38/TMEM64 family protein [Eubacterium sp.]|jgi:uncharacterized membrane protein YdjX (TVP38/TMEM64 family)
MPKKYENLIKTVMIVLTFLIIAILVIKRAPGLIKLIESGNISEIEGYVRSEGRVGFLMLVLLQVIATVSIVLPLFPIYMVDGIIYGKILGTIICYTTNIVLDIIFFDIARVMSYTAEELTQKYKLSMADDILAKTKHQNLVVMILAAIPMIPNGMIPILASKTKIEKKYFIRSIMIGCLPGTIICVLLGDVFIKNTDNSGSMIVFIAIIVALLVVYKLFNKKIAAWIEPKIKGHYAAKAEAEAKIKALPPLALPEDTSGGAERLEHIDVPSDSAYYAVENRKGESKNKKRGFSSNRQK